MSTTEMTTELRHQVSSSLAELDKKMDVVSKQIHDSQEMHKKYVEKGENWETGLKEVGETSAKSYEECIELKSQVAEMKKTIEYLEKSSSRTGGATNTIETKTGFDKFFHQDESQIVSSELNAYFRQQRPRASYDQKTATLLHEAIIDKMLPFASIEQKALEVKTLFAGINPQGGYFIVPEMLQTRVDRIFETSPIRQVANIQTTTSDSVKLLIDDDESGAGDWAGEIRTSTPTATPTIGMLDIPIHQLNAYPFASQQMIDDAGFDLVGWLNRHQADSFRRTENTAFVLGDGAQKPKGFLTYPAWDVNGVYERGKLEQIISGSAGVFTADGINALQNALLSDYQSNAVFGIRRSSWLDIINLVDGQQRPLIGFDSFKTGDTQVLRGKDVIFMDDIPAAAVDSLSMVYGDFSRSYTIVDRMGIRMIVDNVTQPGIIKYNTWKRVGGAVTNYQALKILRLSVPAGP